MQNITDFWKYDSGARAPEEVFQRVFIRYLAEIAKIIRRVLKLVGTFGEEIKASAYYSFQTRLTQLSEQVNHAEGQETTSLPTEFESLRRELNRWRASIPAQIQFDEVEDNADDDVQATSPCSWESRQQSSLRIRKCTSLPPSFLPSLPFGPADGCHVLESLKTIILQSSSYIRARFRSKPRSLATTEHIVGAPWKHHIENWV